MIKGISYWSFPGGLDGSMSIAKAMETAKKYGYESIELSFDLEGELSLNTTEAKAKEIAEMANNIGIKISSLASGMYWGASMTSDDKSVVQKSIDATKKYLEVASNVGVDTILVIPGAVDIFFDPSSKTVSYCDCYKRASDAIAELIVPAKEAKVCMGIENVWNKFLLSPKEMAMFIDQFNSPFVGSYFDVGNCLLMGYPEHWITYLGKRIKKVHFKDFRRAVGTGDGFVDLLEGDVNWPEVMKAFKEIGYDGYVTAEMIPGYTYYPEIRIKNTSCAMDAILGR